MIGVREIGSSVQPVWVPQGGDEGSKLRGVRGPELHWSQSEENA